MTIKHGNKEFAKTTEGGTTTIYRISRTGQKIPLFVVTDVADGRIVFLLTKSHTYRLKTNEPIEFKNHNGVMMAVVNGEVKLFREPNYFEYEREIHQANRMMLHVSTSKLAQKHGISPILDYDTIRDNMLDFILAV